MPTAPSSNRSPRPGTLKEVSVPLRVGHLVRKIDDLSRVLPELQAYLNSQYSRVGEMRISYSGPRRDAKLLSRDAWILIAVLNPFTQKVMGSIADDACNWLTNRFMKVEITNKKRKSAAWNLREAPLVVPRSTLPRKDHSSLPVSESLTETSGLVHGTWYCGTRSGARPEIFQMISEAGNGLIWARVFQYFITSGQKTAIIAKKRMIRVVGFSTIEEAMEPKPDFIDSVRLGE